MHSKLKTRPGPKVRCKLWTLPIPHRPSAQHHKMEFVGPFFSKPHVSIFEDVGHGIGWVRHNGSNGPTVDWPGFPSNVEVAHSLFSSSSLPEVSEWSVLGIGVLQCFARKFGWIWLCRSPLVCSQAATSLSKLEIFRVNCSRSLFNTSGMAK